MILIFGGAYQGKLDYALGEFGIPESEVYYCDVSTRVPTGKIIYGLENWFQSLVDVGLDVSKKLDDFIAQNPHAIVICSDISCGVVPIDPNQRQWREETGRAMGRISQHATKVVRVFCGIPTVLK